MSGSASLASTFAFAPVFVVKFGSRLNNNNGRKKKSQNDNGYWHVCDSLCPRPSSFANSSSPFSLFLLIFLIILCSIGGDEGVKASEASLPSFPSNNNNGVPSFDVNDLRNLIEIFPEFREYVLQVVSSHVEKQNQQQYNRNSEHVIPTTTEKNIVPFSRSSTFDLGTSPNSRRDYLSSFSSQKAGHSTAVDGQSNPTLSKHSYGWPHFDDYHPIHNHDHHSHNHGYGYGPAHHQHSHKGWGWSSDHHDHHQEVYKDPKYHYQVGYQLGKDVSCVLGLLGFKSIKDFSIHSIFSFLKKLKYLVLIGLAFKLGVILSPIALPLLFPIILLAVIAKILPLLLIVVLLFKLLKTQLKLGIGRRDVDSSTGDLTGTLGTVASFMEGTNISRLRKSIDDVTQTVMESESCVKKIICKMVQGNDSRGNNSTLTHKQDTEETAKSIVAGSKEEMSNFVFNIMHWIFPNIKTNSTGEDSVENNIWECDKIQCSYMEIS